MDRAKPQCSNEGCKNDFVVDIFGSLEGHPDCKDWIEFLKDSSVVSLFVGITLDFFYLFVHNTAFSFVYNIVLLNCFYRKKVMVNGFAYIAVLN